MIKMNLHQIAAIVGGQMVGKEARIQGVCTDSRTVKAGELFVALKGEQFNGEKFCQQAADQGAAAVLVSQAVEVSVPQIICEDALQALTALAKAWLKQCQAKVIAITGSNGKTTVKNMLYTVLSQSHKCFATPGNLNNEIGVPLSVLQLGLMDEFAVIEMGAAQLGDIEHLCQVAPPDVALVNNVSNAHVGRFGSVDNIAKGKGEIYQALGRHGVAVINRDDAYARKWIDQVTAEVVTFGSHEDSDVCLLNGDGVPAVYKGKNGELTCHLTVLGKHNQYNAAAVIAIAQALSISDADIIKGLATFQAEPGRMELVGQVKDVTLINDAYNANLASSQAAIDVLKGMPKPTVLVMGDMAELGEFADEMHQGVGAYAAQQAIDRVMAVGQYASQICQNNNSRCETFQDVDGVVAALKKDWPKTGTILVKGSRSMKMERVVEALMHQEVSG